MDDIGRATHSWLLELRTMESVELPALLDIVIGDVGGGDDDDKTTSGTSRGVMGVVGRDGKVSAWCADSILVFLSAKNRATSKKEA